VNLLIYEDLCVIKSIYAKCYALYVNKGIYMYVKTDLRCYRLFCAILHDLVYTSIFLYSIFCGICYDEWI